MTPNLSRRNVRRLSREYGLSEGAIREMLTIGAGTNKGDVIESATAVPRRGLRFWLSLATTSASIASIYVLVCRYFS